MVAHLNINPLGNTIHNVRKIYRSATTDILCINETNLDSRYTDVYQYLSFSREPNRHVDEKLIFRDKCKICNQVWKFWIRTNMHMNHHLNKETVYTFCVSSAEPGKHKKFFEEVTQSLSNMANMYDKIMIIGDPNINTNCNNNKLYHLSKLCEVFDLSNFLQASISHKAMHL